MRLPLRVLLCAALAIVPAAFAQAPPIPYDPTIFQKPLPPDQLTFITPFDGKPSGDLWHDKQFRKLAKAFVTDCEFHYGVDVPLDQAMDDLMSKSPEPVRIRDHRYVLLVGKTGMHHDARAFVWIDLQQGIGLGGFYFHPGNGEPTPTLAIFSRQVKERALGLSDLPLEFAVAMAQWSDESHLPPVTVRYFLTGNNRRILLEHDEDFCAPLPGMPPFSPNVCQQMNADASDLDVDTAYYLKQVDYRTNATAHMIFGGEQNAFLQLRTSTCGAGPASLACHIRLTHEHIHTISGRPSGIHGGHR